MFSSLHHGRGITSNVPELKHPIERKVIEASQYTILTQRAPFYRVAFLVHQSLPDLSDLLANSVEGDISSALVTLNQSKTRSLGIPRERQHLA